MQVIPERPRTYCVRFRREQGELISLAMPIVASQFLNFLLNMVDIAMVGHLGAFELAAAGLGIAYYNVFYVRPSSSPFCHIRKKASLTRVIQDSAFLKRRDTRCSLFLLFLILSLSLSLPLPQPPSLSLSPSFSPSPSHSITPSPASSIDPL
jgi:hypothetical protein